MKIAMIFFSLNVRGGSASVFVSLAKTLKDQGHKVDIICYYYDPKNCFPEILNELNVKYIQKITEKDTNLNNSSILGRLKMGIDFYINAKRMGTLFEGEKYDAIYASEAAAYIPALQYKKKHKVPVYWSVFDPISLVDDKRPGLIIHAHAWFKTILQIHSYFDSKYIKQLDAVIVPTNKMKRQLDSYYDIECIVLPTAGITKSMYSKEKSSVIRKRLQTKFKFSKNKEIILYSQGHFLPHRRYEDTLQAIKILQKKKYPLKYIISGSNKFDPQYFNKIKMLVDTLGLNSYVLLDEDFKTNDEIVGYYQYCDIFVFVSVEQTWGLAPFEAMACKKPIIISQGVGCSEFLENNKEAYIVPERSPMEIAEGIESLITDTSLYKRIADGGYKKTVNNFTYDMIAEKLVTLIQTKRT